MGYVSPFHSPRSVRTSQQPNAPQALPPIPVTMAIDSLPSTFAAEQSPVLVAAERLPVLVAAERLPVLVALSSFQLILSRINFTPACIMPLNPISHCMRILLLAVLS